MAQQYRAIVTAFGCTKQWADLTGTLARTSQAPSWYRTSEPVPRRWCAGTTVVPAARGPGPSSCRQHVILGFALA